MRAALRELFGHDLIRVDPAPTDADLWVALSTMWPAIARMSALDPITSELVRLACARAHNCRACKALRNVRAVDSGGDEATFGKIDHFENSDLDERHKVALRLVDALIWTPARLAPGLADQVRATFSPEEQFELVFDVARNAMNKTAVALGTDDAGVDGGLTYYDTDPDGRVVYGLTPRG